MRKIIAYLAVSADGFIARKDGSIDWLDRPHPPGNYGFATFLRSIDTVVWGRNTYDQAVEMGQSASFGPHIRNYVFTHRAAAAAKDVEFVNEAIPKFAKRLRAARGKHVMRGKHVTRGKHIWMMGGAGILSSFLDAGEIDEFSIHVIPIMIGEGIPLAAPARRTVPMKLLSTKRFPDGVVHLNYKVLRHA